MRKETTMPSKEEQQMLDAYHTLCRADNFFVDALVRVHGTKGLSDYRYMPWKDTPKIARARKAYHKAGAAYHMAVRNKRDIVSLLPEERNT
jgi:hypothetical protein